MACILTRHVTHWACLGFSGSTCTTGCFSSRQIQQLRTGIEEEWGNNQQPGQLYAKEMCRAAWGKWWSHQILAGFLIHTPTSFF
jgi:hypothetical protein